MNKAKSHGVTIATRGSKLALWQAQYVATKLKDLGITTDQRVISTTGDQVQDRFLHEIGGKGLFIRELEQSLLAKETQLAVHSLKDLPAQLSKKFQLAAILPRHSPHDVIIWHPRRYSDREHMPLATVQWLQNQPKLTLATASLRRTMLLKSLAPKTEIVPIRGNVDTRLRKLEESSWDGIVLAEASLERLGWSHIRRSRLDADWFTPCAAQGALAIETLADSTLSQNLLPLDDEETRFCVDFERSTLSALGGDCTMPCGVYCRAQKDHFVVDAVVLSDRSRAAMQITFQKSDGTSQSHVNRLLKGLIDKKLLKVLEELKIAPTVYLQELL